MRRKWHGMKRWRQTQERLPLTVRLLALYPLSWRQRYGEELAELLTAEPVTPTAILFVLTGALDAHLHRDLVPSATTATACDVPAPAVSARLRTALLTSFCAMVGFTVAALAFAEAVNDLAFAPLMQAHAQLRGPWSLLIAGGAVLLAAVLAGGLPIVVAVSRDAWSRHRRDLRLFLVPPCAALVLASCEAFEEMRRVRHLVLPQPLGSLLDVTFHALFVLGAGVSTGAVCVPVLRSAIPTRLLRFALVPAAVATLAMCLTVAATIVWLIQAHALVPARLGLSVAGLGFVALVLVLATTTMLALRAVLRALVLPAHATQVM